MSTSFPEEALAPFLLVEAPRILFPFARQIVAESVQNMGFAPLLLEPIDFASAYMSQLQAAQQQAQGEAGETGKAAEANEAEPEAASDKGAGED